jgi:hypothetical protein
MSDTLAAPTKTLSARHGTADGQVFAQVEKWMAAIRDINGEPQQNETTFRVRLRPTTAATE